MALKRLHIVVPYRDRAEHLRQFVPHLRAYFSRDKADHNIPYSVTIVEQEPGLPFNRGALKNIGYLLGAEKSEYTCFHDIDYLPIWADYSWTDAPTPMAWYGAEMRPIAAASPHNVVINNMTDFFGGVVLTPNAAFRRVDGYANDYWGWGYEDYDLAKRYQTAGVQTRRRKGTFFALDHDNEGFLTSLEPTPIAHVNKRIFEERWQAPKHKSPCGLSTLDYSVIARRELPDSSDTRPARYEIVTVRLAHQPRHEQVAAITPPKVNWPTRLLNRWLQAALEKK